MPFHYVVKWSSYVKSLLRLPRHTAFSTPLLEAYFNARLSLPTVAPDEAGARLGLTNAKEFNGIGNAC